MTGSPSVFDVANFFQSRVDSASGAVITPLKLQKLCYYAQAWNLVFYDEPIFPEDFKAWAHGPACHELFEKFREYRWRPIEPVEGFEPKKVFSEEQLYTLEEVWRAYGCYDAKYLEELTHSEEPWIIARKGLSPGERSDNIISLKDMKNYYSKFVEAHV